MSRIGISLNEVLRDFIGQLAYTYNKYIGPLDLKEGDVTNFNLLEFFPFPSLLELNRFMYQEACYEIFGSADQLSDNLMNHFNQYLMDTQDDGEHEIILISREVDKSISSTFFFLSKTLCKADKVVFVTDTADKWKHVDILITANPVALAAKPDNKISVKVAASYNKEAPADFTVESLLEFMKDEKLRDRILNTKITTYEET